MIYARLSLTHILILFTGIVAAHSCLANAQDLSADALVKQAGECAQITERLERLRCFDQIFATPVTQETGTVTQIMPATWQRAMSSAEKADAEFAMHLSYEGDEDATEGNAWLTLTATNQQTRFADNAHPVLMMSCIDRLSRIELLLPQELNDARVKISLPGSSAQYWRSDDSGYVLTSARGLPAIDMMKKMAGEPRSVLRSNSQFIDGLTFNTASLPSALTALRQRCRW